MDKGREQLPEHLELVFPKIPDEFWDIVVVKKAKGNTGEDKVKSHVIIVWLSFLCWASLCVFYPSLWE